MTLKEGTAMGTDEPTTLERTRLSRRALLKTGGAVVGSVGAASVLAACRGAGVAAWTPMPSPTSRLAMAPKASPVVAEVAPSAMSMASPSAAASGMPMASAAPADVANARQPSPPDFAVPPPYRPASSAPIPFDLTSNDGPGEVLIINANPLTTYRSMNFGR
ncbi:MAG TPA: hypothetical protein VEG29_04890, partial [Candidatus Binatia bacterium]|nr:hypothetical protein [Candidatus Binatia bacterium]